jgi:4-hydroxythreonine-4-phosphate dehydrogenase
MTLSSRLPLAVTMGEPAGIGPELILMARRDGAAGRPFCVFADPALMRARAKLCGIDVSIVETDEAGAVAAFSGGLPVIPLVNSGRAEPSNPTTETAAAVIEAIDRAVIAVRDGRASAVVTAPIMKDVLYRAGFRHPGHTEYLGDLAARLWQRPVTPVMMIWSPIVAVVPVTIHIPLARVPEMLTEDLIVETASIVAADLKSRFGLAKPRLALAGLNPHAGENGALGHEDADIIVPAVARLREAGIDVRGPLPADTMFHDRARQQYDAALCMYHDQALAPAKALAFDEAVNVTLGLPFVRTSPDHGTAFDLAGSGRANPTSFMASLALASRLAG